MQNRNKAPRKDRRLRIRWLMFAILAAFILIALVVIWFFQVRMLSFFYLTTKFSELETVSAELQSDMGNHESFITSVYESAAETQTDIIAYEIKDGKASVLVRTTGYMGERAPFLTDMHITKLYYAARDHEGEFVGTLSFDVRNGRPEIEVYGGTRKEAIKQAVAREQNGSIGALHVTLRQKDNVEYLMIQMSEITPIQTTVTTLQRQFILIGLILLLLAFGLAFILSKWISRPIEKVNKQAKLLAQGAYPTNQPVEYGYREIGELADTLRYASIELSKTDALQQELISNISHDLRTPLTMIRGYSEMMRDIPGENTPENMQVIIDETNRLSELVSDLLDISKIRAGTQKPNPEYFSLTGTIQDTMLRYDKLINRDGYHIEFFFDSDVMVFADRKMILQVVYNLINNAIHYTGTDLYVCVRQQIVDSKVRISIYDTGEGIAQENIPMIWDRYYKVDKVHKRAEVGTGLGLSIVKGVLELHHASYGVNSTVGVGSEFWFELDIISINKEKQDDN